MDRRHQRWTRQLLCRSVLLPHPSMLHELKLISLPLASRAFLRLALSPDNEVMLYGTRWEGVIARENVASRIQAPLRFVLRLRLKKGGRVCGTLQGNSYIPPWGVVLRIGVGLCLTPMCKIQQISNLLECNSTQLNRLLISVP